MNYKIYYGDKLIEGGHCSSLLYQRYQPSDISYHVIYSYRWRGIEYVKEESFHSLEKSLTVTINQPEIIYPGQKVPVSVHVTDYKNRDAKKTNLTAYAVNTQLGEVKAPELPYFGTAKGGLLKTFLTFNTRADINNYKAVTPSFAKKTHLSESPYYTLLYNTSGYGALYEDIENDKAEFSPFVNKGNENLTIYTVYVNKRLIYVANTNIRNPYSFVVDPGFYDVQLRTQKRMITIKNVEFRKGKKLFLCVRDDSVTTIPNVSYVTLPPPYLKDEETGIAKHLLYFKNNFVKKYSEFYFVQGSKVLQGTSYNQYNTIYEAGNLFVAGPFDKGAIRLVSPGKDSLEFYFEPGVAYTFYDDSVTTKEIPKLGGKVASNMGRIGQNVPIILNDKCMQWPLLPVKKVVPLQPVVVKKLRTHPALHDYFHDNKDTIYADFFLKNLSTKSIKKVWIFNREDEINSRITTLTRMALPINSSWQQILFLMIACWLPMPRTGS